MYNVSTAFHAAFADYGREIKAKGILNGQTELDGNYVQEITATPAFDSSDGISVGSACSGRCKIRIYKPDEPLRLSGRCCRSRKSRCGHFWQLCGRRGVCAPGAVLHPRRRHRGPET